MSMSIFSLLNKDAPFQAQCSEETYVSLPPPFCVSQTIGSAQSAFVPFKQLAGQRVSPSLSSRSISQLRPDTDLPPLSQVLTSIGLEVEKKPDEAVDQMGDAPADDSIDRAKQERLKKAAKRATKYYKAHRAQITAKKAKYRDDHRAQIAAQKAEYRRAHKAEIVAHDAEYRRTRRAKRAKIAEKD